MSRYSSSSLSRRRSGGGAWLWVVMGMILGLMCAAVFFVGALAFGAVLIDPAAIAAANSTQTPWIITSTPPPVTPTDPPTITPTATATVEVPLIVQPPTASPTLNPTLQTLIPTGTPTTGGATAQDAGSGTGTTPNISTSLLSLASEIRLIAGGTFQMGTTAAEVVAAVDECLAGYGGTAGTCQLSWGEDAQPQHAVTVSSFNMEVTEVSYQ